LENQIFGFYKNRKSPFLKSEELGDLEEKGDTQNIQIPQFPHFPQAEESGLRSFLETKVFSVRHYSL